MSSRFLSTKGEVAFTTLEEKSSIASMNNNALWPYFSPSYLQLGVEWFYLVPLLFLAHTCIRLIISKYMWQFICNTMQINNSLNSKFR